MFCRRAAYVSRAFFAAVSLIVEKRIDFDWMKGIRSVREFFCGGTAFCGDGARFSREFPPL